MTMVKIHSVLLFLITSHAQTYYYMKPIKNNKNLQV